MNSRILIVEDEEAIASAVAQRLASEGFLVDVAADGPGGVLRCAEFDPHLVILDVMLPGFDGLEVCRRIQAHKRTPVLMLTARDDETDMLIGLGVGADDYVTKPFSQRELVARVHAILRRASDVGRDRSEPAAEVAEVVAGDIILNKSSRRVSRSEESIHLTPTEFNLLMLLVEAGGSVMSRDQLLADVWGYQESAGVRTVDSHVRALRRKIAPSVVRTVHSMGYALGDSYLAPSTTPTGGRT